MPKRPKPAKPTPAGLVKNVAKVAARAKRTNATRAKELVALIREKLGAAAAAFYDVGAALTELSQPALVSSLGYRSFEALVKTELGFSMAQARKMMAVAGGMKRSTALSLGFTRAAAVVELASATPEDDTPEQLARGTVTVRGHHAPLRPERMTARAIQRAAQVERRSHLAKGAGADGEAGAADAALKRVAKLQARLAKKDPRAKAELVTVRPRGGTPTLTLKLSVSLAAFEAVMPIGPSR
jgi:hypothetical protein